MKKILTILALLLTVHCWAETHQHVRGVKFEGFAEEQDPKCLTILPMDSSIILSPFYEYPKGTWLQNFTIIASDITERFVGNTIKEIVMALPAGPDECSATIYIADAWETDPNAEPLWSAEVSGWSGCSLCSFPCDFVITKPLNLIVGYIATFKKAVTPQAAIVPTNRYYGWYTSDNYFCDSQQYDYSNYLMFYGYTMYTGLAVYCMTEGEAGLKDVDLSMESASVRRSYLGGETAITAEYSNYGCKKITSAEFKYVLDGKEYVTTHDSDIGYLAWGKVEAPFSAPTTPKRQHLEIYASKVNGEEIANPMKSVGSIITIDSTQNYRRRAVMEEYTETQCGWCPRGIVALDELTKRYPDDFIAIAEHYADDAYDASYLPAIEKYCGGSFPGGYLNRLKQVDPYYGTATNTDPRTKDYKELPVTDDVEAIFTLPTEGTIRLAEATLDRRAEVLTVQSEVTFNISCVECPYTVAYSLTEDNVQGLQENYFALSDPASYKGDQYLYPLCSVKQWYYANWSHVGRGIWDALGVKGSLDGEIEAGVTKSHEYEIYLPQKVVAWENVNLVAMLLDEETGEVVNACQMRLMDLLGEEDQHKLGVETPWASHARTGSLYNMSGQRVAAPTQHGIYILDGQKVVY